MAHVFLRELSLAVVGRDAPCKDGRKDRTPNGLESPVGNGLVGVSARIDSCPDRPTRLFPSLGWDKSPRPAGFTTATRLVRCRTRNVRRR